MPMRRREPVLLLALALALAVLPLLATGCAAPRVSENRLATMQTEAAAAVDEFIAEDPAIEEWFDDSRGYAIFPNVGKGGIGVGGAYGTGLVFEQGRVIGTSALTQATIGFQLGGQSYQQVVFLQDAGAVDRFTAGDFEFSAQASAVALTAGASADASFRNGMAIFTMQNGGLMYEASVGGQKFSFRPTDGDG